MKTWDEQWHKANIDGCRHLNFNPACRWSRAPSVPQRWVLLVLRRSEQPSGYFSELEEEYAQIAVLDSFHTDWCKPHLGTICSFFSQICIAL